MKKTGLAVRPVAEAQTRRRLAPSRFSALVRLIDPLILRPYLGLALKFAAIEIRSPERILEALRDFQAGRTRLIVAFRHAYGDEPQLLFHVFNSVIPRLARRGGNPLARSSRVRMVHDYAVPLWGGAFIRFLLPRAGAVPVYHVKTDMASIKEIRSIALDDPSPLALAPEGQISYHSETLPRIEQGVARIGFWCAADLEKAGRPEKASILPLSIHYRYDPRDEKKVRAAVSRLSALCGLRPVPLAPNDLPGLQAGIEAIETRVLEFAEAYYEKTRGTALPEPPAGGAADRQSRWETLLQAALDAAERTLGLSRGGDVMQRVYRIRQECWDRILPEAPIERLSRIPLALAHRRAGEAWFAMRHMELVDLMSYYDAAYLAGRSASGPAFDRVVEAVVNLQDLCARLMGGDITTRPNAIRKKAVLVPGSLIDLSARLPAYRQNARRAAREATDELAQSFENCIEEYLNEKQH